MAMQESKNPHLQSTPRPVQHAAQSNSSRHRSQDNSADNLWAIVAACLVGMMLLGMGVWYLSHRESSQGDAKAVNAPRQPVQNSASVESTAAAAPAAAYTERVIEVEDGPTPPMMARSPVPGAWSYKNLQNGSEDSAADRQRVAADEQPVEINGKWSKVFRERPSSHAKNHLTRGDIPAEAPSGSQSSVPENAQKPNYQRRQFANILVDYPAPEIVGKDRDGTEFRLSDYRGKVVLLHFWSGTCKDCQSMIYRQKALSETFKSDPLMIVGVNVNGASEFKLLRGKFGLRNAAKVRDFDDGPAGPIAGGWNVDCTTQFVIDREGVIRKKLLGYMEPKAIATAVKEVLGNSDSGDSKNSIKPTATNRKVKD